MCGITGYSGKEKFNVDKIQFLMYYNSMERDSQDATGIWSPKQGIVKNTDKTSKFLSEKSIEPDSVFIGHARNRSSGFKTGYNAHPFAYGNIIGCQNGTLDNHWNVARHYKLNLNDYDVDGQIILKCLDLGPDYEVLTKMSGPSAFLWWNVERKELTAFRNSGRPLYYGYIDGNMYICSEVNALAIIGCIDITMFKEDLLYRVSKGEIKLPTLTMKSNPISCANNEKHLVSTDAPNYYYPSVRSSTYPRERADTELTKREKWAKTSPTKFLGAVIRYTGPDMWNVAKNVLQLKQGSWYIISTVMPFTDTDIYMNLISEDDGRPIQVSKFHTDFDSLQCQYLKVWKGIVYGKSFSPDKMGQVCIAANDMVEIVKWFPNSKKVKVRSERVGEEVTLSLDYTMPVTFGQWQAFSFALASLKEEDEEMHNPIEEILTTVAEYVDRLEEAKTIEDVKGLLVEFKNDMEGYYQYVSPSTEARAAALSTSL